VIWVEFNIIATVGTAEVDLAPYPRGSATVPADKARKIYAVVLSNNATGANTLTVRIYREATLEAEFVFNLPSPGMYSIVSTKGSPLLVVPAGRTLRAVASAVSVIVMLSAYDE
jgi:hypothetical protein